MYPLRKRGFKKSFGTFFQLKSSAWLKFLQLLALIHCLLPFWGRVSSKVYERVENRSKNVGIGEKFEDGELELWPMLVNAAIILIYYIHVGFCIAFYEKNLFDCSKEVKNRPC